MQNDILSSWMPRNAHVIDVLFAQGSDVFIQKVDKIINAAPGLRSAEFFQWAS